MKNQLITIVIFTIFASYIFASILVTLFNFNFKYFKKWNEKKKARKKRSFMVKLEENNLKKLIKMNNYEIIILEAVFSELYNQNKTDIVNRYFRDNNDCVELILKKYRNKGSIKKAFILFFILSYYGDFKFTNNAIDFLLSDYLLENSLYCTEYALKIIFNAGSEEDILRTIILLNDKKKNYCSKSFSEIMQNYKGNKYKLAQNLIRRINLFDEFFQVIMIEFIMNNSNEFNEEMYTLFNNTASKEVKCAIIKYFGNHKYEKAHLILTNLLKDNNLEDWEYLALAAKSLLNYKSYETVQVLKGSLISANWYIRKNSAKTLIEIIGKSEMFKLKKEINDRYALDMIEYSIQEKELKR